ncbi:flagellar protein FliS [Acetoanaerobium pronyense]|uniref:Flagellar secretion chaperone FliS n=1 Tax=Acetoanaerobium pronyense TaxID=1482736 RepID=A0ABS4KJ46_9FIRM|nr:flagellar export chaperone FliS [Acetoanaerobium pronyense]MBP2027773.1 flagellar protein FliS [Acetoanaerobium pronyense]
MAVNNPYTKYKEQSVSTATPEELTLMLYNGCIKFMNLAKIFMDEKNLEKVNINIQKAQDIINELNLTLNMDIEISTNLRQLYDYVNSRLVDANINKDKVALDDAKTIVSEMRDTWKEAIVLARKGK